MSKTKKKVRPLKSNISSKFKSQHKSSDKKAREIKSTVILDQLDKLREKGLITEEEYKSRRKQIFGLNNKVSEKKKK